MSGLPIVLSIPLPPKGKGRPRATAAGGHARVYTPAATRRWEAQLAACAQQQLPDAKLLTGPLVLDLLALMPRPQRLMRRKDPEGEVWCPSKPDADNIAKSVLDGLKSFWRDDAQIVRLVVEKAYAAKHERPRVLLRISEAEERVGGAAWLELEELTIHRQLVRVKGDEG